MSEQNLEFAKTIESLWNKKLNRWVKKSDKTPDCEYRQRKIFVETDKPEWEYHILSIERLNHFNKKRKSKTIQKEAKK